MEVYKKINQAIDKIKNSDLKKAGYNSYSEYDYYTPEQVDKLVYNACKELSLFVSFNMPRDEFGIYGKLTVIDLDSAEEAEFIMASDIPSIKATNISQQLGGAMTYTKRYMLMNVFDIVDNNLDFDGTDQTQKQQGNQSNKNTPEQWLNKYNKDNTIHQDYWTIVNHAKDKGMGIKQLREHYKISKAVAEELETDLL